MWPCMYTIHHTCTNCTWVDAVPSHTRPVFGERAIHEIFTVYMAGIQYVHDQTVRRMNEGLHPDDIAASIRLPPSLASHSYLRQLYG